MNPVEMLLNYLDISKLLVILTIILITVVTYFILSSDSSIFFSDDLNLVKKKESSSNINAVESKNTVKEENKKEGIKEENKNEGIKEETSDKSIEIKGFFQNEINEKEKKFKLSEEIENLDSISQKLSLSQNTNLEKNEELSIMFIESLSSLNSWNDNEVEKALFKGLNWNLEGKENKEDTLVSHYISPQNKVKYSSLSIPNLSLSQSSINTSETDDGEDDKEKSLLSEYKLGICRTFEKSEENKIKTNITKEISGGLFKIYSEGSPSLIKKICREETIPGNFDECLEKYEKNGYNLVALSGKKMKMNYIQSQRIDRAKCESNMIFLGFVALKVNYDGYNSAFS